MNAPAIRRIIICADDFGMNPAIDEGVLELARLGRLNATTCLVHGASFSANASALRGSGLRTGLHLNFTEPGSAQPMVVPLPRLICRAYLRRLDSATVHRQIAGQLDRFEAVMGRAPDFVDGHQHVHQLPQIRDVLLAELFRRYPGSGVPALRCTRVGGQRRVPWRHRAKAAVIQTLGGRALCQRIAGGLAMNGRFFGVYDLRGGVQAYAALLAAWLEQMDDGDLLMCHPAGHIMREDPLGAQRVAEFHVLAARETGRHLARLGFVL